MDFLDVVDQVVTLLRSRGRITYRALKRQFTLDDDVLEDLKAEIISGQRLAVDEDGTVLVWTGGEALTSTSLGTAGARPEGQSIDIVSPPVVPQPPDAERRQLTVMSRIPGSACLWSQAALANAQPLTASTVYNGQNVAYLRGHHNRPARFICRQRLSRNSWPRPPLGYGRARLPWNLVKGIILRLSCMTQSEQWRL